MTFPTIETPPTEQIDWLFTFGGNHTHPETGESLGNSYVRIHGTEAEARTVMVAAFGQRWAFQYDSAEQAGVAKYGLTEIALPVDTTRP